jgi:hypothetical protein
MATVNILGKLLGTIVVTGTVFACPLIAYAESSPEILKARLSQYATYYSEVRFLHLDEPEDTAIVSQLPTLLGAGADNVDYEHDPEARQWLLEKQFSRISMMVRNDIPSATLFRTGENAAYSEDYVCVITMNASFLRSDELSASRFMAGIEDDAPFIISKNAILDNNAYLLFTLDHEVFHCLNGFLHGPAYKKTRNTLTASYHQYRGEYGADLYAALAARYFQSADAQFLENFAQYRVLSLESYDAPHYTADAFTHALNVSANTINNISLIELAHMARAMADATVQSRHDYAALLGASYLFTLRAGYSVDDLAADIAGMPTMVTNAKILASLKHVIDRARDVIFDSNTLVYQ